MTSQRATSSTETPLVEVTYGSGNASEACHRGGPNGSVVAADVPDLDEALRLATSINWHAALPPRAGSLGWRLGQGVKRVIDVVLAGLGLIVLLPLFAILAVVIVLDSPGPILYKWRVLGYRGRFFTGYKLRTMVPDADELKLGIMHLNQMNGPVFKSRHDPRVTSVGRLLRRYSLDELPQLWSVIRGDMSLVGPRPMFPHEFTRCMPEQRLKLAVKPGVTCLWQVAGRADISEFEEWVRLDLRYIREWNLWLDVKILWRTLLVVLSGHGAY